MRRQNAGLSQANEQPAWGKTRGGYLHWSCNSIYILKKEKIENMVGKND